MLNNRSNRDNEMQLSLQGNCVSNKPLTMSPTKASVKPLSVDVTDIFRIGSMKQLPFTIPTNVFVHLLFSYSVRLVKMRILNSFYFLNIYCTSGSLELAQDILVLRGTL